MVQVVATSFREIFTFCPARMSPRSQNTLPDVVLTTGAAASLGCELAERTVTPVGINIVNVALMKGSVGWLVGWLDIGVVGMFEFGLFHALGATRTAHLSVLRADGAVLELAGGRLVAGVDQGGGVPDA